MKYACFQKQKRMSIQYLFVYTHMRIEKINNTHYEKRNIIFCAFRWL